MLSFILRFILLVKDFEDVVMKQSDMGSTPLSGSILFKIVIISEEILVIHFQI